MTDRSGFGSDEQPCPRSASAKFLDNAPQTSLQIDTSVSSKQDTLLFQQAALFGPAGRNTPLRIHHPVTGQIGIGRSITKRTSYPAGTLRCMDKPCQQAVSYNPSLGNLPHDIIYFRLEFVPIHRLLHTLRLKT